MGSHSPLPHFRLACGYGHDATGLLYLRKLPSLANFSLLHYSPEPNSILGGWVGRYKASPKGDSLEKTTPSRGVQAECQNWLQKVGTAV